MAERLVWFIGARFFSSGSRSRLGSFISVLAMAGLVMGVGLLIVVLSVMNGFDREMRLRILGLVPHIQLFQQGGISHWQELRSELASRPGIASVTPFTSVNAMLSHRGNIEAAELMGLDPGNIDARLSEILPDLGTTLAENRIVLSATLARQLALSEGDRVTVVIPRVNRNGDQLAPAARAMQVAAVVNTHTAEDNALGVIHIATAGKISGYGELPQGLRIRVDDVFQAREIGYSLIRTLTPDFSFIDWLQTHGNLYQAIKMSRQLVGLLVFLIIAIAVFNVVAMLVMTVVDKRPAVAILKTVGASNGTILGVFLVQGTMIGFWGCLLGVLIGVPVSLWLSSLVAWLEDALGIHFLNSEIYPIDYLPSHLQVSDVATIVAVALVLNFLATLYPAWKAARVRPAEVLRYE